MLQINSQGHPDIVAETESGLMRIEVEADIYGYRARALTEEDLDGMEPRSATDKGYFALVLCGPYRHLPAFPFNFLARRALEGRPL